MDLSSMGRKILWVDTETTGTDTSHDDIIQVAGLIPGIDSDMHINLLMQPAEMDLDNPTERQLKALEISGYTINDLYTAHSNALAFDEFKTWLGGRVNRFNKSDKLLIAGYNVKFDIDMLRTWWDKRGDKWFGSYFYPYTLDVMNMIVKYLAFDCPVTMIRPENLKLGTVLKWAGIEPEGDLHDAMTDIVATKKLFEWIME